MFSQAIRGTDEEIDPAPKLGIPSTMSKHYVDGQFTHQCSACRGIHVGPLIPRDDDETNEEILAIGNIAAVIFQMKGNRNHKL